MTITQLSTFLKIKELNSFSAAADSLGYAQSTVTTQIKQLEDELGCVLFERLGKTISLTSSGERLIAYAEKMLQLEREIRLDVTDEENPAGVLKLGVSESLCISRFPEILMEFNKNNPRTEIRIQFVTHENIPDLLQCIHPFADGNGRVSRLLTLLLMYKCGFNIGKYVSFEEQINLSKEYYYEALQDSSQGWHTNENTYTEFMKNFLSTLYKCYKELDKRFSTVNGKKLKKTERIE